MPHLLVIQASPRGDHSISRALGDMFVGHWRARHSDGVVVTRDLMTTELPYMDVDYIGGVYAPPAVPRTPQMHRAIARSTELIDEVQVADQLLICTPMYNFTIPAILKSWIDSIVRPGLTFAQAAEGWTGLLDDKPTRVLVATRDVHSPGSDDDQVTPVIRRAFAFMGIRDVASLLAGGSLGVNRGIVPLADHLARFEAPIAGMAREM